MEFGNARRWSELQHELNGFHHDLHQLTEDLPAGVRLVARFKLRNLFALASQLTLRVEQGENELARRIRELEERTDEVILALRHAKTDKLQTSRERARS